MRPGFLLFVVMFTCEYSFAELPKEFDRNDQLLQLGLLNITNPPYAADPLGVQDSTAAIQRAVNGIASTGTIACWNTAVAPSFETLREKHYRPVPFFDEDGVVNVKDHGAEGDGETDDTEAFRKAVAAGDKIFVPKGTFKLTGTLNLRPNRVARGPIAEARRGEVYEAARSFRMWRSIRNGGMPCETGHRYGRRTAIGFSPFLCG